MLNKYSANTPEMWAAAMLVPPVVHEAVSLREPADRIWLPGAQMSTHEPQLASPVRKSCIGSCVLQKKAYEWEQTNCGLSAEQTKCDLLLVGMPTSATQLNPSRIDSSVPVPPAPSTITLVRPHVLQTHARVDDENLGVGTDRLGRWM